MGQTRQGTIKDPETRAPSLAGYRGGESMPIRMSRKPIRPRSPVSRLMLLGGHACFRQALGILLNGEQGLETVAQAGTLSEARKLPAHPIDAALVDAPLPDGSGTDLVERIRQFNPKSSVLLLTRGPDPGESVQVARRPGPTRPPTRTSRPPASSPPSSDWGGDELGMPRDARATSGTSPGRRFRRRISDGSSHRGAARTTSGSAPAAHEPTALPGSPRR